MQNNIPNFALRLCGIFWVFSVHNIFRFFFAFWALDIHRFYICYLGNLGFTDS